MTKNKPTFIMLVGLPGSGKSTFIRNTFKGLKIHSSDEIREELSGDANNQKINTEVFDLLHRRIKNDLKNGLDCCYDATNINRKRRNAFLAELANINCYKTCYIIATPFEVCLNQNAHRSRIVPDKVIEKMYKNFEIPWYNEGWDYITIKYLQDGYRCYYGYWKKFIDSYINFDQESTWHTTTLGEHSLKTMQYVELKEHELIDLNKYETKIAAALHDCGKPFTKTFKDFKGNDSCCAHYYNHANVGAYNSLFYGKENNVDNLLVAALINYHMLFYYFNDWEQKTINKYEKELTTNSILKEFDFYTALTILHEGDKNAH